MAKKFKSHKHMGYWTKSLEKYTSCQLVDELWWFEGAFKKSSIKFGEWFGFTMLYTWFVECWDSHLKSNKSQRNQLRAKCPSAKTIIALLTTISKMDPPTTIVPSSKVTWAYKWVIAQVITLRLHCYGSITSGWLRKKRPYVVIGWIYPPPLSHPGMSAASTLASDSLHQKTKWSW